MDMNNSNSIAKANYDKLNAVADIAGKVLDNIASTKDDLLNKPTTAVALNQHIKSVNEVIVNKLIAKFK